MSDALTKIKTKIRALSEKTVSNGCSEAEAMLAMQKVSELLSTYNLTMTDVDLKDEKVTQKKFVYPDDTQYASSGLLMTIAEFCDCKVWYMPTVKYAGTITKLGKFRKKKIIDGCMFYGFEHDIEMAEYLYSTLNNAIKFELTKFKKSAQYINATVARKSASTSFQHGMNGRLVQRLRELKAQTKATSNQSTNRALVVVKNQMVETGYKKVQLELNIRTTHAAPKVIRDGQSYNAGKVAGDRVNLNRPLNGGKDYLRIA